MKQTIAKLSQGKKILFSGIKPTNFLTLGNYIGALKNWVDLQKEYFCLFCVVDLHSITVRQDPQELREATYFAVASYLAAGIDPHSSLVLAQSHVPHHTELSWVLNCFTYMGELKRMTQFKAYSQKEGHNLGAGLLNYPILMAADILLYQTNLVPVGADQKQHLELSRDLAIRINRLYGEDLFTIPEPFIPKVGARIMDLQNPENKMSKSADNEKGSIYLSDTDSQIRKKIKSAVTDSGSEIQEKDNGVGINNLISIQSALLGKTEEDILQNYVGKQYGFLKVDTAEIVVDAINPIRTKTQELLNDKVYLDEILSLGAQKAKELADVTLREVYQRLGFVLKRM